MSQRYRHRRTFSPGTAFPSPIEPGEIAVNTANRQIAVGDAAAGTLGVPLPLLGVRIFDARASYATNDYVVQGGSFYRAKSAINPGAFNASQWDVMSTDAAVKAYADAGDAAVTTAFQTADATIVTNYQSADAALTTSVNGKVAKAGDTMTGPLVLPADPTLALQSATKQYVDNKIAAIPTPSSLTVSDTPPTGVPDGALWWESDSGLLYVRYNDGNTTQWVIAAPQPDINAFMTASQVVRVDAPQMLLPFAQQQARQNIYAAPFDAMAYSGLQINGAMDVSQEKGTNGTTVSNTWACDGWRLYFAGAMAVTAAQTSAIVSGFPASLGITVQTAQASLGAADVTQIYQAIEGYRIARLAWGTANAQPLTLGFWSAHHRPGLHSGTVVNGANNRSYAFTYTQAVADVPQYNVVTIPGDTTGVWKSDNTAGMNVVFAVACGSTGIAPSANTWLAGSYNAAPGQVNGVATTSDAFRLTGVTVLPGNEAPSAARSPFVMRSYDQELLTCQRYWEKVRAYMIAYGVAGAGQAGVSVDFLVEKRVVPTLAIPANGMFNCTFNTNTASTRQANMVVNVTATGTFIIDATFTCDARL